MSNDKMKEEGQQNVKLYKMTSKTLAKTTKL